MRFIRFCLFLAACAWLSQAQASAGTVKLQSSGKTNENNQVEVKCDVTDGKLHAVTWLLELVIDGNNINPDNCQRDQKKEGTQGVIFAPLNLKAGKYKVKIKVKLNDDSTVTDERDVDFMKEIGGDPPLGLVLPNFDLIMIGNGEADQATLALPTRLGGRVGFLIQVYHRVVVAVLP